MDDAPKQAPISFIPTPSAAYRQHRKAAQLLEQPGMPRPRGVDTTPVPLPYAFGARVLMWKQDRSVDELPARLLRDHEPARV